ncbi:hypothetical protein [Rhizobium leguminosarum]|uniref:hypothetical protein n=1 Tax=Rhizobium leguminosarum TaxID=384 RepID=UPI0005A0FA3D|nr:hypothetical protein [Rhizobium leguminosarum]
MARERGEPARGIEAFAPAVQLIALSEREPADTLSRSKILRTGEMSNLIGKAPRIDARILEWF